MKPLRILDVKKQAASVKFHVPQTTKVPVRSGINIQGARLDDVFS